MLETQYSSIPLLNSNAREGLENHKKWVDQEYPRPAVITSYRTASAGTLWHFIAQGQSNTPNEIE